MIKNGQVVSIGRGCGSIAVVEHEFIHALGLSHEHARYDRDDHITIIWENIKESNNIPNCVSQILFARQEDLQPQFQKSWDTG